MQIYNHLTATFKAIKCIYKKSLSKLPEYFESEICEMISKHVPTDGECISRVEQQDLQTHRLRSR